MTTDLTGSDVTQQQVSQEIPKGQITQTPYNISTQQQSNNFRQTGGMVMPPIGTNPPDDNWPPIPGNPLPTYVHPDGSQVWVIPGPPTSIYVISPNPYYGLPGQGPFQYQMIVNQSDYPGLHQINNPYHNWVWNPSIGQWQRTTPQGGQYLREIWKGWQGPEILPPTRKNQNNEWEHNQEWQIIPGYNQEYTPGYQPNYISPTNIPNQ